MLILFATALPLIACSDDENQKGKMITHVETNNEDLQDNTEKNNLENKKEDESEPTINAKESGTNDSKKTTSEETRNKLLKNTTKSEEENQLSKYSPKEIEYARVWLQLGPNQELDELNVRHISADTPLNPNDETSVSYPENVVQLAGGRLVDGSVTYSGNGDGTINVYNVPLRWDGHYPAGEEFYIDMIKNIKLVSIDLGNDEKIIELIKLLAVEH